MTNRFKKLLVAGTAALAIGSGVFGVARPAHAQVDPGFKSYAVREDGIVVAEIMRVDTDPGHYTEHWILYPTYVYPSAKNRVSVQITPGLAEYKGLDDFFARVPWAEGSKYVETECFDGTKLGK